MGLLGFNLAGGSNSYSSLQRRCCGSSAFWKSSAYLLYCGGSVPARYERNFVGVDWIHPVIVLKALLSINHVGVSTLTPVFSSAVFFSAVCKI